MALSDGGHVWPPRASDLRIQELTGNAQGGSKPDDVFKALRELGYIGSLDDMWNQHLIAKGPGGGLPLDTGEEFTDDISGTTAGHDIDEFTTAFSVEDPVDWIEIVTSSSGFWMNAEGTSLWFCADTTDTLNQWTMSTPYDVSTAVASTISGDIGRPWGLFLNADMSRAYISEGGIINEYTLGTPGDASTLSAVVDAETATGIGSIQAVWMNVEGTLMVLGGTTGKILDIAMPVAWDLTSAVVGSVVDVSAVVVGAASVYGLTFDPAGGRLFLADFSNSKIHQYNCTSPFDIQTASDSGKSLTLEAPSLSPHGLWMDPNGDGDLLYHTPRGGADKAALLRLA